MKSTTSTHERYQSEFQQFAQNQHEPTWLNKTRQKAMEYFTVQGFPNKKMEEWRHASIEPIIENTFPLNTNIINKTNFIAALEWKEKDWIELVFVNGLFSSSLSLIPNNTNIQIQSMKTVLKENPDLLKPYLTVQTPKDAFTALNEAFMQDGAVIHILANQIVKNPIHLIYLSQPDQPFTAHIRNVFILEPFSQAHILETYQSAHDSPYFNNCVTQIILKENSKLTHCKFQLESYKAFHMAWSHILQESNSYFQSTLITWGSAIARNNIHTQLSQEGSICHLNGLYFSSENSHQHQDHHILIEHIKGQTESQQTFKGLVNGQSHAVFVGKVIVHPNAQKSNASQLNKNLLLAETATVDAQPQLEILADDVRCSHGATVGQLDENALFYLKSRGLNDIEARRLLMYAFASEIIEHISIVKIRDYFKNQLLENIQDDEN